MYHYVQERGKSEMMNQLLCITTTRRWSHDTDADLKHYVRKVSRLANSLANPNMSEGPQPEHVPRPEDNLKPLDYREQFQAGCLIVRYIDCSPKL